MDKTLYPEVDLEAFWRLWSHKKYSDRNLSKKKYSDRKVPILFYFVYLFSLETSEWPKEEDGGDRWGLGECEANLWTATTYHVWTFLLLITT